MHKRDKNRMRSQQVGTAEEVIAHFDDDRPEWDDGSSDGFDWGDAERDEKERLANAHLFYDDDPDESLFWDEVVPVNSFSDRDIGAVSKLSSQRIAEQLVLPDAHEPTENRVSLLLSLRSWLESLPPMSQRDQEQALLLCRSRLQRGRDACRGTVDATSECFAELNWHTLVVQVKHLARLAREDLLPNRPSQLAELLTPVHRMSGQYWFLSEPDEDNKIQIPVARKWPPEMTKGERSVLRNGIAALATRLDSRAFSLSRLRGVLPKCAHERAV